jgi:hypothetical protein
MVPYFSVFLFFFNILEICFFFLVPLSFKRTEKLGENYFLLFQKKEKEKDKNQKMIPEEEIAEEWARVQHVPSLRKHYGAEYPKWYQRFRRKGYLVPSPRTPAEEKLHKRREYARDYYKRWRATHKDKVRETQLRYYRKALQIAS